MVFSGTEETTGVFDLSEVRRNAARDQQSSVRFWRVGRWILLAFGGFLSLEAFSSGRPAWERFAFFSGLFVGIGVLPWVFFTWQAKNLQYDIPDSIHVDGRGFQWTYPSGKIVTYEWGQRLVIEYWLKEIVGGDGSLQASAIDIAPPNGTRYRPRPRVTSEAAQVLMNAASARGYHLDPTPRTYSWSTKESLVTMHSYRLIPPESEGERNSVRALLRGR